MDTQKRQAGADFEIVVMPAMIDAYCEFQLGDGSTVAEIVTEICLHMFSNRPIKQFHRDWPHFWPQLMNFGS
jgi:hypothetical protein